MLALRLIARDLPAFVPAGRDLFDERPAQCGADRAAARTPARAAGRRRGLSAGQHARTAAGTLRSRDGRRSASAIEPHPRRPGCSPRPIPLRGPRRASWPVRSGRNRLVGWRRSLPRLLRDRDLAGPARVGILRRPASRRGWICCTGGSHERALRRTALPVELHLRPRRIQRARIVRAREGSGYPRWRSPTNARWPASCVRWKPRARPACR